jgi:hypothetical protein
VRVSASAQGPARVGRHGGWGRRRLQVRALAIVVGLVLLLMWLAPWHAATPITLTGSAFVHEQASGLSFTPDSRLANIRHLGTTSSTSFGLGEVSWSDASGVERTSGTVECLLGPGMDTAEDVCVELSFVRVRGGTTPRVVTHVQCLDR